MVIESKYNIGQEIWNIYKHDGEVRVRKDKIVEIIYNEEKGILYMLSICDDIEEKDVVPMEDTVALIRKVLELQKEIDIENEKKAKNINL